MAAVSNHPAASTFRRLLAVGAWLASIVVFVVLLLAFWGVAAGAMLVWSLYAVPLEVLTRRWLATVRAPVSRRTMQLTTWSWTALVVAQLLLWALMSLPVWNGPVERVALMAALEPLNLVYGVFPVIISVAAMLRAGDLPPEGRAWTR